MALFGRAIACSRCSTTVVALLSTMWRSVGGALVILHIVPLLGKESCAILQGVIQALLAVNTRQYLVTRAMAMLSCRQFRVTPVSILLLEQLPISRCLRERLRVKPALRKLTDRAIFMARNYPIVMAPRERPTVAVMALPAFEQALAVPPG